MFYSTAATFIGSTWSSDVFGDPARLLVRAGNLCVRESCDVLSPSVVRGGGAHHPKDAASDDVREVVEVVLRPRDGDESGGEQRDKAQDSPVASHRRTARKHPTGSLGRECGRARAVLLLAAKVEGEEAETGERDARVRRGERLELVERVHFLR